MASGLAALAPLAGILKGIGGATEIQSQQSEMERRRQLMALAQLQEQRESQQFQQQQHAGNFAGNALGAIPDIRQQLLSGMQQQQPQQSPMQPQSLLPQQAGGGPGAVRGSWFGNAPGWNDPNDSGLQASGKPVSAGPGIALPSRATLGQNFDVTAPSGQTMRLPQTDVGPAQRTGRGVDINAPAAQAFGYTPQNFPTDKTFIVKAANQAIGQTAVGQAQAGAPIPLVKGAAGVSRQALGEIDPAQYGQATSDAIIKAVEKAGPNASGMEKLMAVQQLQKLMLPEERMQMQAYMQQNRDAFRASLAEYQSGQATERERMREEFRAGQGGGQQKGWQIVQGPDGQPMRVNPNTGETGQLNLPAGTTKLGTQKPGAGQGPLSEAQAQYWAKIVDQGGALPPGVSRNKDMITQIMAQTAGAGSDPGEFIAKHSTVTADSRSQSNMTKMADAATSFERTASQNFDLALKLSKDAVPTDWGPWLNAFIEKAETQAGNKDVPPYVAAMMTAANEYAKIMSGSTGSQGSTVDLRREAAELFSPYLSAGQIDRVVAIAKADMANRKQSLYGQIDDIKSRLRQAPTTPSKTPTADLMGGEHGVGSIIKRGGKSYRVIGGDPADPDVEEVK